MQNAGLALVQKFEPRSVARFRLKLQSVDDMPPRLLWPKLLSHVADIVVADRLWANIPLVLTLTARVVQLTVTATGVLGSVGMAAALFRVEHILKAMSLRALTVKPLLWLALICALPRFVIRIEVLQTGRFYRLTMTLATARLRVRIVRVM